MIITSPCQFNGALKTHFPKIMRQFLSFQMT